MKKQFYILSLITLVFTSCSSDDSNSSATTNIVEEAVVSPLLGGPNQQNQVYISVC